MSGHATCLTPARLSSTTSLENSAPRCRSSIGSMILPSQWNISSRCTANGYVTYTGLSSLNSTRTWCLRRGEISPRSTFCTDAPTPKTTWLLLPRTQPPPQPPAPHVLLPGPPTYRQNTSPLGLVVAAFRGTSYNPKDQYLADLVQIGLYFFLRSCEYTKTNSHRRTTKFSLRDIQFQDYCGAIPFNNSVFRFLNELLVTLFLDTQKKSFRGESISMENTCLLLVCPVAACARRLLHLRNNDNYLDMPICIFFGRKGVVGKSITSTHLVYLLRIWAGNIGFARLGFQPHKICSHSLRSGGAVTLHQSGQFDSTIKVIGRWRLYAFLIYHQGQVATFTKGVSVAMKQVMWITSTARTPQQPLPSEHC